MPCKCGVCGKRFQQSVKLAVHAKRHTGDKPYHCEIRARRFVTVSELCSHRSIHTGERPYARTFCEKSFACASTFKEHLHAHTKENLRECPDCGKPCRLDRGMVDTSSPSAVRVMFLVGNATKNSRERPVCVTTWPSSIALKSECPHCA